MNVFVFGTGRCGTVCFEAACQHATNYTSAHESNNSLLRYPDRHIETNSQFRMVGPELIANHPGAVFVWLTRETSKVETSYDLLDQGEWLSTWALFMNSVKPNTRAHMAHIAVRQMLRDCQSLWDAVYPTKRYLIDIDAPRQQFTAFWLGIGAKGDMDAALAEFNRPRNTSKDRGDA